MFHWLNFSRDSSVFGLDIGYQSIKLVQLEKDKNYIRLIGSSETPIVEKILEKDRFKNKAATATMIKEACRKAKPDQIRAKKIVSALPESFVFSKTIQMPKMTPEEYTEAIPVEAAQYLPIPVEDVYLDHQVLIVHPDEPLADILIVATPKKLVDDFVEMTKMAGLELVALETKPIAVGRGVGASVTLDGTIVVEIGTEITRISIWDNNSIRLITSVRIAKNHIDESINLQPFSTKPNKIITKEEFPETTTLLSKIADEILNSIKYHQNRDYKPNPIKSILICGSGAKITGIDKFLEQELKIKTEIVRPRIDGKEKLGTEFIPAFGLALRDIYE